MSKTPRSRERFNVPLFDASCSICGITHHTLLRNDDGQIKCLKCIGHSAHKIGECTVTGQKTRVQEHHVFGCNWSGYTITLDLNLHELTTRARREMPEAIPEKFSGWPYVFAGAFNALFGVLALLRAINRLYNTEGEN